MVKQLSGVSQSTVFEKCFFSQKPLIRLDQIGLGWIKVDGTFCFCSQRRLVRYLSKTTSPRDTSGSVQRATTQNMSPVRGLRSVGWRNYKYSAPYGAKNAQVPCLALALVCQRAVASLAWRWEFYSLPLPLFYSDKRKVTCDKLEGKRRLAENNLLLLGGGVNI